MRRWDPRSFLVPWRVCASRANCECRRESTAGGASRASPSGLALLLLALSFPGLAGCDRKPSCKRLHERLSKCEEKGKGTLPQDQFVALCERRKHSPATQAQIACSAESGCKAFRHCMGRAKVASAKALLEKRWKEVMEEAARGSYTKAFTFCDVRWDDLGEDMRKRCKEVPREAVAKLTSTISARRDSGEVPLEASLCWDLKRLASRVGAEARKAADDLCEEVEVARRLAETRKQVETVLTSDPPYLPYHCQLPRVEEMVAKVQSSYTKKAHAEVISLCYKKLGKVLFQKRVPDQKRCEVRDLYEAISALGIQDPDLAPWMDKAREQCEKKPDLGETPEPEPKPAPEKAP